MVQKRRRSIVERRGPIWSKVDSGMMRRSNQTFSTLTIIRWQRLWEVDPLIVSFTSRNETPEQHTDYAQSVASVGVSPSIQCWTEANGATLK